MRLAVRARYIFAFSLLCVVIIALVGIALGLTCAIIFRILRRHQIMIRDQTKLHEDAKTLSRSRKSAAVILQVAFFIFRVLLPVRVYHHSL